MHASGTDEPLRVAVTVEQSWQRVPGGTASSTLHLLAELALRRDVEVWGVAARHRGPAPVEWRPPVPVHHLGLPRELLYRSWHGLRRPAVHAGGGPRPDVVHATSPAVPPASAPLVATVHDLAFLTRPELYTRRGVRFLNRGTDLARREAAAVVVPSRFVARDCADAGFDADRVHVVPHGVAVPEVPPADRVEVRARLGVDRPYVLWCGTHEPRKNLRTLLLAFAQVAEREPDLDLVLVGPTGWGEDSPPPPAVADRVHRAGFLPSRWLHAVYAEAAAFAYPSLQEGFGLPVLEAMAHGVPVVTSLGTPMAEVVGGAGLLVDPLDADALAGALLQALHDGTLGPAGREVAGRMTWAAAAARLAAVYATARQLG